MAEIKSFPNNQDVYIGAEWVMKWLHGRTSGVFGAENNLSTSVVPDSMSVEVSDGIGWISNANGDGIVFWNDSEQSNGSKLRLTHDVADGTLDRIDRIVVTWETTNYVSLPTISVLKGVASSNPVPPALTNNNIKRQISLTRVNVPAGTVSLSPSMITDERLDPEVCGIVTETVRVDTSTMQNQFEALLKAIQLELQNLNAGTAALLKTGDTMQGILNMGGNKITNVAAPTDENDAVPRKLLDDALNAKLSMELLWENASPGSQFASQTVVCNISEYDFVYIDYFESTLNSYHGSVFFHAGFAATLDLIDSSGRVIFRQAPPVYDGSSPVGFNFSGAFVSVQPDNNYIIPYRIYGIKGVSK